MLHVRIAEAEGQGEGADMLLVSGRGTEFH